MAQNWDMKTFMKGASILTISAIVVKILSAVYRVPYQNMVGDKGFYIYQQVYPFIGIFIIWTSYGFAVSVSKLLASEINGGRKTAILKISLVYLLMISSLFFIILMIFAPTFASAMGDAELTPLLRAGAFIVLVMPFLAVLKGSFQSTGQMIPVAVSNVGEQASRVLIVLFGTWLVMTSGASLYRAGEVAMWGAVVGEAVGVLILAFYYRNAVREPAVKVAKWPIIKELTIVSLSVSASSLILLFFQLIDSFTVLNMLFDAGMEEEAAMALKGVYDRGQPLVQMGILIATTLALAIVPLISHHATREEGRGAYPFIKVTYRVAFLFGSAATVGLMLVLPFVNEMLFETKTGSIALIVFVIQIFWLSLLLPLTAILQGAGKIKIPTLLFAIGVLTKWIGNAFLVEKFSILGAAISGNISFMLIVLGIVLYFKHVYPIRLAPSRFYKWTGLGLLAMTATVLTWIYLCSQLPITNISLRLQSTMIGLTAVLLGAAVFLWIILKARILQDNEWHLLPFGKRLARVQQRLHRK